MTRLRCKKLLLSLWKSSSMRIPGSSQKQSVHLCVHDTVGLGQLKLIIKSYRQSRMINRAAVLLKRLDRPEKDSTCKIWNILLWLPTVY